MGSIRVHVITFWLVIMIPFVPAHASLKVDFYHSTCPLAESIVRRTVIKAVTRDPGLAAGLIRMHFHDCFVRGCDGSVLLDESITGNRSEKKSPANDQSLRGYEVIDKAKAKIEARCPQTVSCADIVAFAARDSTLVTGGIEYPVLAGRRDGRISIESEVIRNLPFPTFNAKQLEENFAQKGLSLDEMVTLSAAHSIGISHCSSFASRLYSFNSTHKQDPSMNPQFAAFLKTKCLPPSKIPGTGVNPKVPLDIGKPNRLDATYYKNLQKGRGLLTSDQTLLCSPSTVKLVRWNARHRKAWADKFANAMVRMGYIDVLTGSQGEIRKNCRVVNH